VTPKLLQAKLRSEIPLAEAMDVRIRTVDEAHAVIEAPLLPNMNHKGTAFGGSIHSVAVLACWSLLTNYLENKNVDYVVIQKSEIDYLAPIATDFSAEAKWSSVEAKDHFDKLLSKKGLARATLIAEVRCDDVLSAKLTANFAAAIK
jgi:thioesterase domain-containing protein